MSAWIDQSYIVLPGFMAAEDYKRFQSICDSVYRQWLLANPPGHSTNIAFLTEEHYFADDRSNLTELLNLIGGSSITRILEDIAETSVRFHNTQYFTEQLSEQSPYLGSGAWHRDTQFEAPDLQEEKRRIGTTQSAHFRIAFADDSQLEIVPGSGHRWDTDEELALRRPLNTDVWARTPQTTSDTMPGATRIRLNKGDAVIFNAWSIHRGHYHVTPQRRTLDIIYAWGPFEDWSTPLPSSYRDKGVLEGLTPDARRFFERLAADHASDWDKT